MPDGCVVTPWGGSERVPDATPHRPSEQGRSLCRLEEADIGDLRDALRENRISFPSQVPTFSKHDRPDLQRKLAQLYFVLGWNCSAIGARYGLLPGRVRQVLNTWKRRAVETGYIQHIPQATSAILGVRLCAAADLAADGAGGYGTGPGAVRHHPAEVAENRGCGARDRAQGLDLALDEKCRLGTIRLSQLIVENYPRRETL